MIASKTMNLSPMVADLDRVSMERLAVSMGESAFRGRQLFAWVHGRQETDFGRMSNLPARFRSQLAEQFPSPAGGAATEMLSSDGSTRKRLVELSDGQRVETVLMEAFHAGHEEGRHTVCVSSQVGCALGCSFCVTGQMGFARQLSPGEIVEQVYHYEKLLRGASSSGGSAQERYVDNVVFMGMGEPLANYRSVLSAVRLLTSPDGLGIGARRITISTAGLVPGIDRLAEEGLQLGLAISLHAPTDDVRSRIMPVNRRYPIAQLIEAAVRYSERTGRRVTYEYAMIDGINDDVRQARQLAALLSGRLCHVNLIPLNRSLDPALKPSSPERVLAFRRTLDSAHIPCTVRQSRGQDIMAACGQLRYRASNE